MKGQRLQSSNRLEAAPSVVQSSIQKIEKKHPARQHQHQVQQQRQVDQQLDVRAQLKWPEATKDKRPLAAPGIPVGERRVEIYQYMLNNRIIFISGYINDAKANQLVGTLMALDAMDPTEDIKLYVDAIGGSSHAMIALIDTMATIQADIQTVAFGQVTSLASLIVAAGTKGKRLGMRNARLQVTQQKGYYSGDWPDVESAANEAQAIYQTFLRYYMKFTGLSRDRLEDMMYRQFWTGGEEAIKYGFIDGLVEDAPTKPQPNHPVKEYFRPKRLYTQDYA